MHFCNDCDHSYVSATVGNILSCKAYPIYLKKRLTRKEHEKPVSYKICSDARKTPKMYYGLGHKQVNDCKLFTDEIKGARRRKR